MNEIIKPVWKDSDFDRLVDGELPPEDYRRLLLSLDAAPDGWKRLGRAFLEGQAWRQDLAPAPVVEKPLAPRAQAWWMRPSPQWLATAAALMLVFALGTQVDQARYLLSRPSSTGLAVTGTNPPASSLVTVKQGPRALGNMQVVMNRVGGDAEPTEVPVYDGREVDPQQLWQFSGVLPVEVQKRLEQSGQRAITYRHLMPVHLDDGRTIVIPVERIQLVPEPTY
jgi:hypothetical protein